MNRFHLPLRYGYQPLVIVDDLNINHHITHNVIGKLSNPNGPQPGGKVLIDEDRPLQESPKGGRRPYPEALHSTVLTGRKSQYRPLLPA